MRYNSNSYPNRGVSISRDRNGKVRRVGNVCVNYDIIGRITRAGSIFMNYNRGRHSNLYRVGGLRVDYNRWGEIINTRGQVNRFYNDYCNFCGVNSCGVTHGFGNTRGHGNHHKDHDDVYNDDGYYYFKQNGKIKKE